MTPKNFAMIAACLLGGALVLGVVAQVFPWESATTTQGSLTATQDENVWGVHASATSTSGNGLSITFSKNWFQCWADSKAAHDVPEPEVPCPNSIVILDAAGPLLNLGLAALLAGAVLLLAKPGRLARMLTLSGAAAVTIMAILFMIGLMMANGDKNFTGSSTGGPQPSFSPALGFYLGLAMVVFAIAATVLCFRGAQVPAVPSAYPPYAGNVRPVAAATGTRPVAAARPATPAKTAAAAPAPSGPRRLKCPRCQNIFTVAAGAKPKCTSCGYPN